MRVFAAAALLLATALPALAAPPEPGRKFGDWIVECQATPDGNSKMCAVSYALFATHKETKVSKNLLKVSVGWLGPNREPTVIAVLPFGFDLQAGAVMMVNETQVPLLLQRCEQFGCIAAATLPDAVAKALAQAKTMQVGFRPYGSDKTVTIPVPPNGLSEGLAALK